MLQHPGLQRYMELERNEADRQILTAGKFVLSLRSYATFGGSAVERGRVQFFRIRVKISSRGFIEEIFQLFEIIYILLNRIVQEEVSIPGFHHLLK